MISVIMTLYNRAHLLRWCLEAIHRNTFPEDKKQIEINVLDDGSTDGLDRLLQAESERFGVINKYVWDKFKLEIPIKFNCPAQAYNMLVKLASNEIIYKTDPEMVLLDPDFIGKCVGILDEQPNAIIMPFPYHCYEFDIEQFEDIENKYLQYHYPTHITKDNAYDKSVYYQACFTKKSYTSMGGIDERFSSFIGSEDEHHLGWRKKLYGKENFIPLVDSPCIHQYHGGMAQAPINGRPRGVPTHLYHWVEMGTRLRDQLRDVKPNEGQTWGKIPKGLRLWRYENGQETFEEVYRRDVFL